MIMYLMPTLLEPAGANLTDPGQPPPDLDDRRAMLFNLGESIDREGNEPDRVDRLTS
jgi:hypothetical protein